MDGLGLDEISEVRLLAQFGEAIGDPAGGAAGRGDETNLRGCEFPGLDGILEERIQRVGLTRTRAAGENHERALSETLQGVGLLWIQTIGRSNVLGRGETPGLVALDGQLQNGLGQAGLKLVHVTQIEERFGRGAAKDQRGLLLIGRANDEIQSRGFLEHGAGLAVEHGAIGDLGPL